MGIKIGVEVSGFPPKVDSWEVPLECSKCGAQNKVTIAQIKREETIQCVGCGTKIKMINKDRSFQNASEKVQRSLDELERTLRDIGAEFR